MAKVKIYSKPMCSACKTAKAILTSEGVEFDDVTVTDIEIDALIEKGFYALPVIQIGEDYFDGSIPSRVKEVVNKIKEVK